MRLPTIVVVDRIYMYISFDPKSYMYKYLNKLRKVYYHMKIVIMVSFISLV